MKLTKKIVEKISTPDTGAAFLWDEHLPGFGIRVTSKGARSYVVQSRVAGKTRRVTLGRHGVLTVDQARKRAKSELGRMSEGLDPAAEKEKVIAKQKHEIVLAVTLREVMESYLKDRRELKPRSRKEIRYHVGFSFKVWADKPAAGITRDMVSAKFRKISDRTPSQANQAFRQLRALLNYARAQYRTADDKPVIADNPVNVLSDSRMWNKIKARNNYVPLERIGEWWSHVEALRVDPQLTKSSRAAADLVAFITLTGLRSGEARSLRWDQVDIEDGSIKLYDTKNRSDVTLPLSEAAIRIVSDNQGGVYVFSARSGDGHLKDARATLGKLADETGIRVTAHDLRRTFRAVAGKCNVELWRTKALMNHRQNSDVTLANYTDLEDVRYLLPEANAIGEWVEEQRQIAEADNVVQMRERA